MGDTNQNVIEEGSQVLLKKADNLRLFKVQRKREIWLDKSKFFLDGIIGHPYGTRFEVKEGQMIKITKAAPQSMETIDKDRDQDKDNRNLHDSDSNQKLTADEIDQMKKEGVTGEKLIEQLIENSATYQNKTEYAQEKWVKKKKKKHLLEFTVLKPTSRLLCELYWSRGPTKICNLRVDTLGQMLTWGNVRANTTVAVVDSCLGLVTGAVMERLAGFGKVVSFYHGGNPVRGPLDAYNFTQEVKDTLLHFPLEQLNALHRYKITGTKPASDTSTSCEGSGKTESASELPEKATDSDVKSDKLCSEGNADTAEKMTVESAETTKVAGNAENTKTVADEAENTKTVAGDTDDTKLKADNDNNTKPAADKDDSSKPAADNDDSSKTAADNDDGTKTAANDADNTKTATDGSKQPPAITEEEEDGETEGGGRNARSRRGGGRKRKTVQEREAAREDRSKEIERARTVLLEADIDCLIVASKFHPTPIVTKLVDFLAPSRQVVVFSQFKEALEDCYVYLRDRGGVVSYRLTETWLRNYQVLPNRTHPVIQMSGTGGYLLTATTVTKQTTQSDNR